jgi:hypothetical protein
VSFGGLSYGRRLRFAIAVLAAQLLLIATSIAWCVHMILIAKYGEVHFVEANPRILYGEIWATALITLYAATVFILQWKRLGEKRRSDDK